MGILARLLRRRRRPVAPNRAEDDRGLLPIPEEALFDAVRRRIALFNEHAGKQLVAPSAPFMLGRCHASRDPEDGRVTGFAVQVLVNPHLGVP